jgi:hypothetical protein
VFCESWIAPLLDELKYNINLRMHYIGDKQVRSPGTALTRPTLAPGLTTNSTPSELAAC